MHPEQRRDSATDPMSRRKKENSAGDLVMGLLELIGEIIAAVGKGH